MKAVSVIIATCNRPNDLRDCLAAILAGTYPVHEVLVMDQSSDDMSRDVVQAFRDERLRHYQLDIRGKSRALNASLRLATGDILCFTDDDCVPAPGWVDAAVSELEGDPELAVVFGQTLPKMEISDAAVLATTVSSVRRVFVRRRNPYNVGGAGGNVAFRREAVVRVGEFDESLGPGAPFKAVEDNEYFYRAFKLKMKGVYSPKQIVYHKQNLNRQAAAQRLREYRIGGGAFIAKYLMKADLGPLLFYLIEDGRRLGLAISSRDLPYLRHVVKRFQFTMEGMVAYVRWRARADSRQRS